LQRQNTIRKTDTSRPDTIPPDTGHRLLSIPEVLHRIRFE